MFVRHSAVTFCWFATASFLSSLWFAWFSVPYSGKDLGQFGLESG